MAILTAVYERPPQIGGMVEEESASPKTGEFGRNHMVVVFDANDHRKATARQVTMRESLQMEHRLDAPDGLLAILYQEFQNKFGLLYGKSAEPEMSDDSE